MHRDILDRHPVLRTLLYLVTIIAVLYTGGLIWQVIIHFSGIILIFFLAWIVSFILEPLATFLERQRFPRLAAVSLIYFALLAAVVGSIVLAIPAIHSEVQLLAGELTSALAPANLQRLATSSAAYLHHLGLSQQDARSLVIQVSDQIPALTGSLSNSAVSLSTSLLGTAATLLLDAVLVLMLSFYMMLDGGRLVESWITRLPPAWLPDVRLLRSHIETVFGGFLRAQVIIGFTYGFLTWLVLAITGQSNSLISAILAGVLMLIPFIGPFLAVVPPSLMVLLQSPPGDVVRSLILVVVLLVIAQQITMQIIAPRVMSAHVGLHPLLLFAALLVGAKESGAWGAVFAGPIAAVLVAMLQTFFERFKQTSGLYPAAAEEVGAEDAAEVEIPAFTEAATGHAGVGAQARTERG
jgi:predicted PurR-regulated permease PerM